MWPYTACEAGANLWQFTMVPNGITNGVPAFQRHMTKFVEEESLKDTFPYLDNVTVAGRTQEEHDENDKRFRAALKRRKFTLNESKTVNSVTELHVLGYVVGKGVIAPDPERFQPFQKVPLPENLRSLKRVLGMFAYYAKWIPSFADKIRPLADSKHFPQGTDATNAFKMLKEELAKAALQAVDESLPFVVECDASDVSVCATLNEEGRPVSFMSRTLQGSECNYPAVKQEATACIEAIRKWRHWLRRHISC